MFRDLRQHGHMQESPLLHGLVLMVHAHHHPDAPAGLIVGNGLLHQRGGQLVGAAHDRQPGGLGRREVQHRVGVGNQAAMVSHGQSPAAPHAPSARSHLAADRGACLHP
jgi:hypothetical protein